MTKIRAINEKTQNKTISKNILNIWQDTFTCVENKEEDNILRIMLIFMPDIRRELLP